MVPSRTAGWLRPALALCLLVTGTETISKNFVNSSMPEMRPTFVVNFDMATVICQHRFALKFPYLFANSQCLLAQLAIETLIYP